MEEATIVAPLTSETVYDADEKRQRARESKEYSHYLSYCLHKIYLQDNAGIVLYTQ
jgi:hypothetical protein